MAILCTRNWYWPKFVGSYQRMWQRSVFYWTTLYYKQLSVVLKYRTFTSYTTLVYGLY